MITITTIVITEIHVTGINKFNMAREALISSEHCKSNETLRSNKEPYLF